MRYIRDEIVPSAPRMVLGNALCARRTAIGLKQEDVARLLGASVSKVSRIETGQHQFKEQDLARFFVIYQVTDPVEQAQLRELAQVANQQPWWQPWSGVAQKHLQAVVSFEDMAQRIRVYEPLQLPGLLQTEGYARAVIAGGSADVHQRQSLVSRWPGPSRPGERPGERPRDIQPSPRRKWGEERAMARMFVDGDDLVVHLGWLERAAARRSDLRVPLTAVCRVTVEADWWRTLRGDPRRGLWIPGARCIGTRGHLAGTDFVAVRPGRPVVCVELRPTAPFRLLAVSAPTREEASTTAQWLDRTAPEIDTSTPCRQPLPVPEETPGTSTSRRLSAERCSDRDHPG
ncbi:Scr1 family TA system antitoxin-like transcriptional regulator [Streptomyces sp. NPDC048417]|uniref:Scr1 family TA system antitoxin-like transcriptional regulator n=1 Tax=Streptomyces sp. NPDC048417 TaxID=3155387 RepID=UPI0034439C18